MHETGDSDDRHWNLAGDCIVSEVQDGEFLELSDVSRNVAGDLVSGEVEYSE